MAGAFEEEGDYFCISCEDGEDGIFFCIFYSWSGRLLGRWRIIFSISSKKKTDNFLLYLLRRRWRRNFFSQRLLMHHHKRNNSRLLVWNIYCFHKKHNLSLQLFQNYEIILQRWASRKFMNSVVRYSVSNNLSRWWLSISHKRECWWAVWVHYFDKPCLVISKWQTL